MVVVVAVVAEAGRAEALLSLEADAILAVILDPMEAISFGKEGGIKWALSLLLIVEFVGHESGSSR